MDDAWRIALHAASTWALVGLIWTIDVVHYPLFARVGSGFRAYHEEHMRRITPVVGPLMLAELVTGAWLWLEPPAGDGAAVWGAGFALVVVTWAITGLFAVPAHGRLERGGFDAGAHRLLMWADRARTAVWTARGALVLWLVAARMGEGAA